MRPKSQSANYILCFILMSNYVCVEFRINRGLGSYFRNDQFTFLPQLVYLVVIIHRVAIGALFGQSAVRCAYAQPSLYAWLLVPTVCKQSVNIKLYTTEVHFAFDIRNYSCGVLEWPLYLTKKFQFTIWPQKSLESLSNWVASEVKRLCFSFLRISRLVVELRLLIEYG